MLQLERVLAILRVKNLRSKVSLWVLLGLLALASAASICAADDSAPSTVVLPPFVANLSQLNIKLTIRYVRKPPAGEVVEAVYVRSVKAGSIAEKAGLKKGMEIITIQDQAVAGLNSFQFDSICDQAVDDALVLTVKRSAKAAAEEIRIKIPQPDAAKP